VFVFDPSTALIVVDVQNDFADPAGSLYVSGGENVVEPINALAREARTAGGLVVYTQDWHPPVTPHFAKDGGTWPDHCVAGTPGSEFHPLLEVDGEVVRKGTGGEDGYSGFSVRDPRTGETCSTALDAILRGRGITRVAVVGLATDYCVRETAVDAAHLKFETTVLRELVRAVELRRGDASRAFQAMRRSGVILA
jgi:nicotinamidase/pyrazinamidase